MKVHPVIALLATTVVALEAPSQSITLSRTPPGPIRVGDTVTVSLSIAPVPGSPVRGGGVEILYPASTFELLGAPAGGGNASDSVTRVPGTPYQGAAPPPWVVVGSPLNSLQLPIVQSESELTTPRDFSGTVATFQLRATAESSNASVSLGSVSRLSPGGPASLTGITIPVLGTLPVEIVASPNPLIVGEGNQAQLSIRLSGPPSTQTVVSVTRTSGDADLALVGGSFFVFDSSNFDQPQFATFSAAQDPDTLDGEAVFQLGSPGLTAINLTVRENDDEVTGSGFEIR